MTKITPQMQPLDEYNRELLANVHPPDWINPEPARRYNLVVIGAGAAGLVAAAGAAGLGAKVALIERHLLGGDCLNYGCVPSKSILRSAHAAAALRDAARYGIEAPGKFKADFGAVMSRMRRLRAGLSRHDAARRFQNLGVDVFLGQASFLSPDSVQVAGKVLRFKRAVIATGARAVQPTIAGLAEAGCLTNETVFSLTKLPTRLAVIGAGPLGCEFAQAFQRLGSQVTLLHKYERLINKEDADAAAVIQEVLSREGVELILNCQPRRLSRTDAGKVIEYDCNGRSGSVAVEEILIGAGRAPNVEGLNLEAAQVAYAPGKGRGVLVNDYLQTSNRRIYAAGDICSPYQFTHTADFQARLVIQNALFFGHKKMSALIIPWCTYTDPEVAQVGLSESAAGKNGLPYDVFKKKFAEVDRAIVDGDTEGFVKILVKKGSDQILGATIVGRQAGDLISEITTAMVAGLGLGKLANVIHPYPTRAEAIRQTGDLYNRTRLTPRLKNLFSLFLKWRR